MHTFKLYLEAQNNLEQLVDLMLLEALTPEQAKQAEKWRQDNPPRQNIRDLHDHVFGKGNDRITIPQESPPKDYTGHPLHDQIKSHLEPHGFKINDYAKNEASDKHGRPTSISKALVKTKESTGLGQRFNNDPVRQSTHNNESGKKRMVTISRNPLDLAGMSTGRKWDNTSCMNMERGSNRHYIKRDMTHGTLAAYVHDEDDKDITNPHGRILLKRHDSLGGDHSIFHPESRIYGKGGGDFSHTIGEWAKKNYAPQESKLYAKHHEVYNDDGKTYVGAANKFHPSMVDQSLRHATNLYRHAVDNDKHGDGFDTLHNHVSASLSTMRHNLNPEEQKKMDKHLHMDLAKNMHKPEADRENYTYRDHPDGVYHDYGDDPSVEHAKHFHTLNYVPLHPEHVDDIAHEYHKRWASRHDDADDEANEHPHTELEDAILKHGSDKTKADYLTHHKLYGHEDAVDTHFQPHRHIIGPESAKAYYKTHVEPREGDGSMMAEKEDTDTHTAMAKHADDETFHHWLHSPAIKHNANSYSSLAFGSSIERQHKMHQDLKFDNSEHNGFADEKIRGLAAAGTSKSVLGKIAGDKKEGHHTRRRAIETIRRLKDTGELKESTESLLSRVRRQLKG